MHLSRTLAASLAEKHVHVNAILPGVFPSRMTAFGLSESAELLEAGQPTGTSSFLTCKFALTQHTGRVGSPEDIGGLVLLLCSRAGSHLVGAAIPLDGGQNLSMFARL